MKKLRKIVAMLAAIALCVLLPGANTLNASAAEPTTYWVKCISGEWRFQPGTWSDTENHRELYYLYESIKDGDIVVVDGSGSTPLQLNVSVRLSNLTFKSATPAVVSAKSIDECVVLQDSVVAVSGNVSTAYVYDNATCTFNNNVGTLNVVGVNTAFIANVTCTGTVDHLVGQADGNTYYEAYNVAAGKLVIQSGSLKTDSTHYSTTPSGTPAVQAPAAENATQNAASSNEYDDVPKTGESNLIFWLFGIAALCFTGKYMLKQA